MKSMPPPLATIFFMTNFYRTPWIRYWCQFLCVLIAFLKALQWKRENLLGEKQAKFTKASTPHGEKVKKVERINENFPLHHVRPILLHVSEVAVLRCLSLSSVIISLVLNDKDSHNFIGRKSKKRQSF